MSMRYQRLIYFGAVIAISVLLASFVMREAYSLFIIIFAGVFLMVLLSLSGGKDNQQFLIAVLITAFLSRILIATVLYHTLFLKTGAGLLWDASGFSDNGYIILNLWRSGMRTVAEIQQELFVAGSASGNWSAYDFWNAFVYFFTGFNPLSVIFINCLFGALTVFFIYDIGRQLSGRKAAVIAALLTAFWPSTFFWSIQNFKEPMTVFLLAALMWCAISLRQRFRFHPIFLMIPASLALKEIRIFVFLLFYLAILPVSLLLPYWKKRFVEYALLAGLVIWLILYFQNSIKDYIFKLFVLEEPGTFLEWLQEVRSAKMQGASSAFLVRHTVTGPTILGLFLPLSILFVWLAPFPWQLGSTLQIMACPEMLLFYPLIPYLIAGIGIVMKNRITDGGILITCIFFISILLALTEGNVGSLFRHRAIVLPFCFVLIAIGLERFLGKQPALDITREGR